jgi:hypothetical protein
MTPDAQIGLGHGHDIGGMLARADLAMNVASRCKSITGRHSDIRCTATTGIRNRHPAVLLARAWRGVLPSACASSVVAPWTVMDCRFPVHELVRLHGGTRLEGMIRIKCSD